jgi:hypothetical protein
LEQAGLFWVSTVRADGRPHVTPVVAVWTDGALYFTSGPSEQKSRNLAANRHCAVTTGCNTWNEGLDLVLHGDAVVVHDLPLLRQVADAFLAKYGSDWAFEVAEDGTFRVRWSTSCSRCRDWGSERAPSATPAGISTVDACLQSLIEPIDGLSRRSRIDRAAIG